jgi:hypothetical protein
MFWSVSKNCSRSFSILAARLEAERELTVHRPTTSQLVALLSRPGSADLASCPFGPRAWRMPAGSGFLDYVLSVEVG